MMEEPKKFKTKVKRELIRFLENEYVTIEEFCIRCNQWLIDNGYKPVEGTPYKPKQELDTRRRG